MGAYEDAVEDAPPSASSASRRACIACRRAASKYPRASPDWLVTTTSRSPMAAMRGQPREGTRQQLHLVWVGEVVALHVDRPVTVEDHAAAPGSRRPVCRWGAHHRRRRALSPLNRQLRAAERRPQESTGRSRAGRCRNGVDARQPSPSRTAESSRLNSIPSGRLVSKYSSPSKPTTRRTASARSGTEVSHPPPRFSVSPAS